MDDDTPSRHHQVWNRFNKKCHTWFLKEWKTVVSYVDFSVPLGARSWRNRWISQFWLSCPLRHTTTPRAHTGYRRHADDVGTLPVIAQRLRCITSLHHAMQVWHACGTRVYYSTYDGALKAAAEHQKPMPQVGSLPRALPM